MRRFVTYIQKTTKKIDAALKGKRELYAGYIQEMTDKLRSQLKTMNIAAVDIKGRAKHHYSIYRKMQRKKIGIDEIYDVIALRLLVNSTAECYACLSAVYDCWESIPQEFDDYIASPKPNGYQSIHTAIVGPGKQHMEIQIRTWEMHQFAEYGSAAHWLYKEAGKGKQSVQTSRELNYKNKLMWLHEVMGWQKEVGSQNKNMKALQSRLFDDRIYVFTPQGELKDFTQGATPLDFAYHVHTMVGHCCRGAKVNGHIVPLIYQLSTGDQIEVLTSKVPNPSRDWLSPHAGYLKTARARSKVRNWFRAQGSGTSVAPVEEVAQVVERVEKPPRLSIPKRAKHAATGRTPRIAIEGTSNLLTQYAKCCNPLLGDAIVGYITQRRGVVIHKRQCANLLRARQCHKDRVIRVRWTDN